MSRTLSPRRTLGILMGLTLLLAIPARAQEQGGGIQGVVRDSSKAALPGVTVEARSPSMPGVATTVTDREGVYRFPVLVPGTYELTALLQGFAPAKMPNIVVRLGSAFRIDIAMELAQFAETIKVTAEPPIIDVRQNAAISTIPALTLELLPASGRDFTAALTTTAGVRTVDSGVSLDGASGLENHYIVDGLKTTATITGQSAQLIRMDFVEEIQVKSSGYNAEYGASMGGVINVITKSGGDTFRGFLGTYFSDPNFRWNGATRPSTRYSPIDDVTPERYINLTTQKTRSPAFEWLGDLGGPIIKNRLWFYLSNATTYNPDERTVLFSQAVAQGLQTFNSYASNVRTGYTLTGAITNSLRARMTGEFERAASRRTLPALQPDGVTSLANPNTRYDLTGSNSPVNLVTVNLDYVATPHLFVNSKVGYRGSNTSTVEGAYLPQLRHTFGRSNIGLAGVPADLQFPNGYTSTPLSNSGTVRDHQTRIAWDLSATSYRSWKGQHALKAGLNTEWVGDDIFTGATAPNITLQWDRVFNTPDARAVRGAYGYYSVTQNGTYGKVSGNNIGMFVQDSWTPGTRLTINAGVRTERELIPSYIAGNTDLKFAFLDKVAPRLGFAWDVTGNAHWKVYGSYGSFYDIMKLRIARYHFGGEVSKTYYYSLDTPNWPTVTCAAAGPPPESGCPGTYFGYIDNHVPVNGLEDNRLDPAMKPSRTREYVVGLDHELNTRTSVGIRYVHKPLSQLVEDVGRLTYKDGAQLWIYTICNPGAGVCANPESDLTLPNGGAYPPQPRAARDYDAVELRFARRLSRDFFVNANYTWSYLRGNSSGLGNEDIGEATLPSLTSQFDLIYMAYNSRGREVNGRLPNDSPHVFKVQGGYTLPWGTSLAVDYSTQSGELESTTIQQQGRYTFLFDRGDLGRVNALSRVNLKLQHDFWHKRINVAADVRNVFDQMAVTDIEHQPYRDGFTIPDGVYFAAGGYDINAYVQQFRALANDPQGVRNLRDSAFYKQPIGWQGRRTFQFSARYRF